MNKHFIFVKNLETIIEKDFDGDIRGLMREINVPLRELKQIMNMEVEPTLSFILKVQEATGRSFEWLTGKIRR